MSVGGPQYVRLRMFGAMLVSVFDDMAYLVGSAASSKSWRDVDVVVMVCPEKFYKWAGAHGARGEKWRILCLAFSALGAEITGLPIDFKLQEVADANLRHKGKRDAIGITIDLEWMHPDCDPEWVPELPRAGDYLIRLMQEHSKEEVWTTCEKRRMENERRKYD